MTPDIPKPLDAICRKALAHQKADRYPSAAALVEDMKAYLAGDPVSAYKETPLEKTWRWMKRHRTALSRAAALAVIFAIGATAFFIVRDIQEKAATEVREANDKRIKDKEASDKEIAETQAKRAIAQVAADKLKREDDARQEIADFRKQAEEARFYAASANPVAEGVPALDAAKAETKAAAAFAIASKWGGQLEQMPLEEKREGLKIDLYELALEMAQLKSRQGEDQLGEALKYLEQARTLRPPTQSWYRLHARCLEADEKGKDQVASDLAKAADPATPATALDHYLLGEQTRVDSLKVAKDDPGAGKQAGIQGSLARLNFLAKAIDHYRRALRDDPNHYWSHFQLGACYSGVGSYAEAAEALGACIALRPNAPWGFSSRGLALVKIESRHKEAEEDLNQAVKLDPHFRPARLHRASFFSAQKRYKEAEADFAAVIALPESDRLVAGFYARGQMFMDRKMYAEALADFDAVVQHQSGIRPVFLYRARIYLVQEKPDQALANLTRYLKTDKAFDPASPRADEQRGRELRLIAEEFKDAPNRRIAIYGLALKQLQKAVDAKWYSAPLFYDIGIVQEKLAELQPDVAEKRMRSAVKAYSNAIELAPKDGNFLVKRAWTYNTLNQFEDAKLDFAAAIAVAPADGEAYAGLGYVEAMLKLPSPARRHANLAMTYSQGNYMVVHNTACIFGALSRTDPLRAREYEDMAIDQLRHAIELWKKANRQGPNEIDLIKAESEATFPPALQARPEFARLLKPEP